MTARRAILATAAILPFVMTPLAGFLQDPSEPLDKSVPRFMVGFHDVPIDLESGDSFHGGTVVRIDRNVDFAVVETWEPDELLGLIATDSNIRYVERSSFLETTTWEPNDALYVSQENLQRIHAPDFWQYEAGSLDQRVCVIDSGFNIWHADLSPTYAGGYDFYSNPPDDNPHTPSAAGHGTKMASIAAAAMSNTVGIAPVAGVKFFALKNGPGEGVNEDAITSSISWCSNSTARVYSMSFGGGNNHTDWYNGLSFAWQHHNAVLVGSTGNHNTINLSDNSQYNGVYYPGRYPMVIGVACLNPLNDRCLAQSGANSSQAGPQVDVSAPGQSVWTADGTGTNLTSIWMNQGWAGATSEATAHVAGVAALLISRQPNMTNQVVKDLIEENTDDVNASGWDEATGWGIVNASKALQPLLPTGKPTCRYILPRNYVDGGQRATLTGDVNFTAYVFSYSNSTSSVELYIDGSLSGGLSYYSPNIVTDEYYMGNNTYYRVVSTSGLSDGAHSFELKCTESDGDYRWTNRTYEVDN